MNRLNKINRSSSSAHIKTDAPTTAQLEAELSRERHNRRFLRAVKSTVYALITVAAAAVLVATLFLPVLQIYGTSMEPTLSEGETVVSVKTKSLDRGDTVAFYYNNKILIKRVIAFSGEWVNIDSSGTVYVNGEPLDEPYVTEKALGECDLEFPYQIPENKYFVMGDHRLTSVDSRSSAVGCIDGEQFVGKIVFRVWPISKFGTVN